MNNGEDDLGTVIGGAAILGRVPELVTIFK